jgi:serine/threonine-protein kinase
MAVSESGRTTAIEFPSGLPVAVGAMVASKYRVDRILGQGGMGIVVAATHLQLDQRVALKFLLPEAAAHPEIAQRFLREARACVRIDSEHVARVLDVGTLPSGTPFMVMEYLEGEDLSQVLARRGQLPVQETVGFVLEACEAVAEAHSLGMVHRDLKPANLFLAKRPSGKPAVKVLDFGISKIPTTERDHAITRTAAMVGSPLYMSPEQMMSSDKVTSRSDIWSLGIVLYELLGQRLPFPGDTMPELIANILRTEPAPLGALREDIPTELLTAIDTCLQKDPERRYANVAELARALAPFGPRRAAQSVERIEMVLGLRTASVQPPAMPAEARTQPLPPGVSASDLGPMAAQEQADVPAGVRRRRLPFALAAIAAGGLAIAAGVVLVARSHPPAAAPPASSPSAALPVPLPIVSAPDVPAPPAPPAPPIASAGVPSDLPSATPASEGATAPTASVARPRTTGTSGPSPRPVPSTIPAASASTPPSPCRLVSWFDADGNKHFRRECP